MQFNVSQLLREHVGATREYVLFPEPPVHGGTIEMIRTPDGVLVRAEADVVLEAVCSRCLTPFGYPAHISIEEIFYQQVDVATGRKLQGTDAEPESFLIDANHTIDITEAVRQYSEMAAAMQPLCRSDCPGICPVCGQDLTIANCSCERAPIDPRWGALAALMRSDDG
jgi:uncharacterized protein